MKNTRLTKNVIPNLPHCPASGIESSRKLYSTLGRSLAIFVFLFNWPYEYLDVTEIHVQTVKS